MFWCVVRVCVRAHFISLNNYSSTVTLLSTCLYLAVWAVLSAIGLSVLRDNILCTVHLIPAGVLLNK